MKYLIIFALLFMGHESFAQDKESTARIDEETLEVFKSHEDKVRQESAKNPRNRSFPGSFRKVGGEEKKAQKQEDLDELQEFKNDPYIDSEKIQETEWIKDIP